MQPNFGYRTLVPGDAPGGDDAAAVREVLRRFRPGERVEGAEPLGRGHIHATWLVRCRRSDGTAARYVAQRINRRVFRDPERLATNLERVTRHLRDALRTRGIPDPDRRCLAPLADASGGTLARDAAGEPWRVFPYIEGSHARDTPRSPAEAGLAARAFGAFVADLADLDPDLLAPTIPAFHDLAARLRALEDAADRDAAGRRRDVGPELSAARRAAERLDAEPAPVPDALPRRVVHNDCKLDNLLFDDTTGEALCVVDLDTVMPGSVVFDFGELVRTGACPAAEDERDLGRVTVDPALFRALARGYVEGARELLTPAEIRALAAAGPRMALENGVRFLADHLEGDVYFRIARPGHNLDRARAQLRLAERMLDAQATLRDAVRDLPSGTR